jgi:phosphotransferase system HPr-like phosphotransfer protein
VTTVTCPRCGTEQSIEGDGYLCAGCATEWAFVRCRDCGSAFHMQPDTRSWTCPTCGTQNRTGGGGWSVPPLWIAAAAVVVVIVAAVLVFSGGDDQGDGGTGDGTGTGTAEEVLTTTCAHIRGGFQVIRQQALEQTATQLTADADALRAAGNAAAADDVAALATAAQDMAAVIASGEDDTAANQALADAISATNTHCAGA